MQRVTFLACCVAVMAALAFGGCGSSGSETTPGGATVGNGRSSAGAASGGRAVESPIQSRGTKGENPATEAATALRVSAGDCAALGHLAEERLGRKLTRRASPKPPLSRCSLSGRGASISIYLDSGFAANQRYHNRIEETVQFNTEDPAGLPKPVPRVGEKAAYDSDASWIPSLRSLLAVRGNRWLTVTISVAGKSDKELLAEATALARAGFKLTASG